MASWLICPANGGLGKGGPRPMPGCSYKAENELPVIVYTGGRFYK